MPTHKILPGSRYQRGAVGIMMPFMLISVLSVGALAMDVAHLVIVRNELQNAADAAALAGAAGLYPANPNPAWTNGVTKGTNAIALNKAAGTTLATGTVQAGYWNLTGTPAGLQPQDITPGTNDVPAVQVTISRSAGNNGGPVATLLAQVFDGGAKGTTATAVAVLAAPGIIGNGGLFPVALSQCLYNYYWNSATNQPKIDPATNKPYLFRIGSAYHYGLCESGQWTTFKSTDNSATATRDLILNGNPAPVAIGDQIWIQDGTKTSNYNFITVNKDYVMPVTNSLNAGSLGPITAFAAFHVTAAVGGSGKYIEGYFIPNYKVTNSGGGVGPYYGAYVPPRLAK
ncbi:Putative Tad-like Flp pilus-assembly [Cupriavidus sp. YR651]|uniref:TadG family pilus assembly protein n=1 Tax=Cupriavidus sp. YR651 TaxID=1855315 RepID=UPI00088C0943|nr:TadG family pilus assembly protein [Cupriavidus sp. YR651]SDC50996.1 Putative Tad-like Flp pilus-assembly [Cupriavidus sp. YR651]